MDIVTEGIDKPSSVLIRAIAPINGVEIMKQLRKTITEEDLTNGPGKVCQSLSITKDQNGLDITRESSKIVIKENNNPYKNIISETKRIGIPKAKENLLRYTIDISELK